MSRKTHKFTAAAIAATLSFSFVSAEVSGAFAQAIEQGEDTNAEMQNAETAFAPIFVSEEVVQPLPEEVVESKPAGSLAELVSQTETIFVIWFFGILITAALARRLLRSEEEDGQAPEDGFAPTRGGTDA